MTMIFIWIFAPLRASFELREGSIQAFRYLPVKHSASFLPFAEDASLKSSLTQLRRSCTRHWLTSVDQNAAVLRNLQTNSRVMGLSLFKSFLMLGIDPHPLWDSTLQFVKLHSRQRCRCFVRIHVALLDELQRSLTSLLETLCIMHSFFEFQT